MKRVKEIRLYKEGDEAGIIRLFRNVFGRQMSLEEWNWKYRERAKKIYSTVALNESNEIIGHYGGMPKRVLFDGKEIKGIAICDVMVRPDFRTFSLFKKLAAVFFRATVEDDIILGYGFPNEEHMRLAEILGLYEKIEDVWEATKISRKLNGSSRFLYKLAPLNYDDKNIETLWNSSAEACRLTVLRDREYFKWRYGKHPFFSYELWGLKHRWGGALKGLAVLRREEEQVLIADFLCTAETLGPLCEKVENYAYAAGKKGLKVWIPEYLNADFSGLGFSLHPSGTSIPRAITKETLKKDEMKGKFFYTMGDTDFL